MSEVLNNEKILRRQVHGAVELKEGIGAITTSCPCGEFLEMYKADKTFRIQSPERIDPEQTNPDAPWIIIPMDDVGSKNPIVSRVLLQGYEILKAAWFQREIDKEAVTVMLHTCKEQLLVCDKIAKKIEAEVDGIIEKISSKGISTTNSNCMLNPFPCIASLENDCTTFLIHAKRVIKTICELPGKFFDLSRVDNNFKDLAKRFLEFLDKDAPVCRFIESNIDNVAHIIELRNFQEHPKERATIIENFRCTSDMKIVVPEWYVSGNKARPIKEEMIAIVNYLLEVVEAMLIHLVMISIKKEIPYIIEKIEETKIDINVPIKYRLSIDVNKLKLSNKPNSKI